MVTKTFHCKNCSKEKKRTSRSTNTYCSNKCQGLYQSNERLNKWLMIGEWFTKNKQLPPFIKRHIKKLCGDTCQICNIKEWNGKKIILEVDHIDGDYSNNHVDNLRAICPNCHSQTNTYKNRNCGKGRFGKKY